MKGPATAGSRAPVDGGRSSRGRVRIITIGCNGLLDMGSRPVQPLAQATALLPDIPRDNQDETANGALALRGGWGRRCAGSSSLFLRFSHDKLPRNKSLRLAARHNLPCSQSPRKEQPKLKVRVLGAPA